MKITYDNSVDIAYIYLRDVTPGEASKTYACNPTEIAAGINLDFDKENKLIGIEIENASKTLPLVFLNNATTS